MKQKRKKELMDKYCIKSVGSGKWGEGFFDCLENIDKKNIELFKEDFVIKRIMFAKEHDLPYSWLLAQLKNDWKKGKGANKIQIYTANTNNSKKEKKQ